MRLASIPVLLLGTLLFPMSGYAAWQPNGVPLATLPQHQLRPTLAADGAGGAIVVWEDSRNGWEDIYTQRINSAGMIQWSPGGTALCTAANPQEDPSIIADGHGGAIVAWRDGRAANDNDIYAQRINASGAVLWTINGVALCTAADYQIAPAITSDGAGGAIVIWQDNRTHTNNFDVYAQRVNASGVVQWPTDGVLICAHAFTMWSEQNMSVVGTDGAGGAVVVWRDNRGGSVSDIYAQRVNAAGVVQWTANGVAVCNAPDYQENPVLLPDGAGGGIIAWEDNRFATNSDIYAQKLDGTGVAQWSNNGVAVCSASYTQYNPGIISDGAGGAMISWEDNRASDANIYVQRINSSGVAQWTANGIAVCSAANQQTWPKIAPDGAGGAIVCWDDSRSGDFMYDIYAQRINSTGLTQWAPDGVVVSAAVEDQQYPRIVADASGSAIVTWQDLRNGNYDIYAQQIEANGAVPSSVNPGPYREDIALHPNYPNPFSSHTTFDLDLTTDRDVAIDVFDVSGRRVRQLDVQRLGAGPSSVTFDGFDDRGRLLPSGVYFFRLTANGVSQTRKIVITR
jgi:hypothetical protein